MTERSTKVYKNTFSGSVGAGMGSLFNPNGRTYYILEHKVSSKYHKAGESQEIIVDNIEIGRDPRCQVRFDDENFKTVSRHHARIVKEGDMWKLVQLSTTNSTFLNGRPIKTEWYLQSGDEIQLSVNGPKLGFIIPTGKKSTVGSIGLSRRLSLFRQQALRPYKYAITTLACILVLAIGGLGTWNYFLRDELSKQSNLLAQQIDELIEQKNLTKENQAKADSLAKELEENNKKMKDYEEQVNAMKKKVVQANASAAAAWRKVTEIQNTIGTEGGGAIQACAKMTYYIRTWIEYQGDPVSKYCTTGTGVLLDDGRLVTCLHVCHPFHIAQGDEDRLLANAYMKIDPSEFSLHFFAISPAGDKINKAFPLNNLPFHYGSNDLRATGTITLEGNSYPVYDANFRNSQDWAWINIGKSGGLPYDNAFSTTMPIKTHLDILGYPKGVGAENISKVSPIFSESSVAREGLDTDGCVLLSNSETDHGNSGGPVLAQKDGKYVVVGLLSGANPLGSKTKNMSKEEAEQTKWKDRVVPIAYAR